MTPPTVRATSIGVVQVEAFQRGDMSVIEDAVRSCLPWVWRFTKRGFLTTEDGVPMYVRGVENPDAAEHEVEMILAACLGPEQRQRVDSLATLERSVLAEAKRHLFRAGQRSGSVVDVATEEARAEVPAEVEDVDRLIAEGAMPSDAVVPPDAGRAQEGEALLALKNGYVGALDERSRALVHQRFAEEKTRAEVAASFDCGVASVTEREHRVRRKLAHAIRRVHPELEPKKASIDALLADRFLDPTPPLVTRERIATNVLRRIHIDPPRPFAARAAWAVGISAIAFALWLLMFFGVLPNPGDDVYPTPAVAATCAPPCAPGAALTLSVVAPRNAKNVAVAFLDEDDKAEPLLAGPGGASLSLPFGARDTSVPIPYEAEVPARAGTIVAVFSERRLTRAQILGVVDRTESVADTFTATTSLGSTR